MCEARLTDGLRLEAVTAVCTLSRIFFKPACQGAVFCLFLGHHFFAAPGHVAICLFSLGHPVFLLFLWPFPPAPLSLTHTTHTYLCAELSSDPPKPSFLPATPHLYCYLLWLPPEHHHHPSLKLQFLLLCAHHGDKQLDKNCVVMP